MLSGTKNSVELSHHITTRKSEALSHNTLYRNIDKDHLFPPLYALTTSTYPTYCLSPNVVDQVTSSLNAFCSSPGALQGESIFIDSWVPPSFMTAYPVRQERPCSVLTVVILRRPILIFAALDWLVICTQWRVARQGVLAKAHFYSWSIENSDPSLQTAGQCFLDWLPILTFPHGKLLYTTYFPFEIIGGLSCIFNNARPKSDPMPVLCLALALPYPDLRCEVKLQFV